MTDRRRLRLAAFVGTAGLTHFLLPRFYERIVPHALPGSERFWVNISGVAELATALAIANPRTARRGAWAAALLFVVVYPANIQMAVDEWPPRSAIGIGALLRLPLQFPLIWWAIRTARSLPPAYSTQ